MGVVQNAAAQRRLSSSGVVLNGSSQQIVEASKGLWTIDEINHGLRLLLVHAGSDVDHHQAAHQFGMPRRKLHAREATERHANNGNSVRSQLTHQDGKIVGQVGGRIGAVVAPPRMPVARKVYGHQWNPKSQSDGVPRVSVLRPTMHEHQLWIAAPPHQCAHETSR